MSRTPVAERLLRASERHSRDPDVEVDWSAPLDPCLPAAPLHRVSLHGTPLWEAMTPEQRVQLSWHEFASTARVGLWFEVCLMQALLRWSYDRDVAAPHVQYALTEVGDETRHAVMFARAAERLAPGCAYGPSPLLKALGRVWKAVAGGPSMFASVLVAEEVLDRLQRELLVTPGTLPLAEQVSRVHVVEEARHVSYAREALLQTVPRLGRVALAWHQLLTVVTAACVVSALVDPRAYAAVGLDPDEALRQLRAAPQARASRVWSAEKVVAFLIEVGMVPAWSRPLWRRWSLLA